MALVAACSTTVAIVFITFGVLGQKFLISAAAAGFIVVVIVVYVIGAAKLSAAIRDGNETGLRVVTLTRQVAGVLTISIIVGVGYAVLNGIGNGNNLMPLQMIITNLLIPVLTSAALLLLLRFIRRSFTRQETLSATREARKKKGNKSTASVSPATDFKESSTAANGGSTTTGV